MFLLLFLVKLLLTFSDLNARVYCFEKENLKEVQDYISPILKPSDTLELLDNRCLKISVSKTRVLLFDRWLGAKYRYTNLFQQMTSRPSKSIPEHCHLELVKKQSLQESKLTGIVGQKSALKINKNSNVNERSSRFITQVGRPVSMSINEDNITLKCYKRSDDRFEIELELSGVESHLKTSFSLSRTKEVNLGEVIKKIKNGQVKVSLKNIKKVSVNNKSQTTFILKLLEKK